ncbi:MAG: hypothetical protein ACE5JI_22470 [Acidobacteriota bacterium]
MGTEKELVEARGLFPEALTELDLSLDALWLVATRARWRMTPHHPWSAPTESNRP